MDIEKPGSGKGPAVNQSTTSGAFTWRFVVVVAVFITCLITANIIVVKQISIGDIILPAGIVIFPLSYVFGDILTEVYGYKRTRRVIWLGFVCNLIAVIAIWLGRSFLPPGSLKPKRLMSGSWVVRRVFSWLPSWPISSASSLIPTSSPA